MTPDDRVEDIADDQILAQELRDQLGPERSGLADKIQFGMEVEQWLSRNPVAGYIVGRAQSSVDEATKLFLESASLDTPEVKKAHMDAYVGATIITWVQEAISEGREAHKGAIARDDLDDDDNDINEYTDAR